MRNDNAYHRVLVNVGWRKEPKAHSKSRGLIMKSILIILSLLLVSANPVVEKNSPFLDTSEYSALSYYNMYVKKIGFEKYSLSDWMDFTEEERHNAFYQTYFVTTTGSSGNNGLSEGGAWSLEHVDGTSTLTSGDLVNIKAGNYGKKYLDFSRSGVHYRGYKNNPGDVVTTQFSTYNSFEGVNAAEMPLIDAQLDFTTSSLVDVLASNVTLENIQITNGWMAVSTSTSATDLVLRNIIITKMGDQTFPQAPSGAYYVGFGVQFRGDRTLIENTHVENCGAEGLNSKGADDFEIRYSRLAANETRNGMDYYFLISGGSDGGEIHHCEVIRDPAVPHPGHGFDLKDFATNNYIHDIYLQNSTVEMNFIGSNNNLWEDVEIDANFSDNAATVAIINGAHHNTLRRFILNDVRDAIRLSNYDDGLDDSGGVSDPSRDKVGGGDFNILEDFIINHADVVITHNPGTDEDPALMEAEGNVFRRFTLYDIDKILVTSFPIKDYVFEDWLIHSPNFSGNAFTLISGGQVPGSDKSSTSPHFSGPFNYAGSITNFTYTNNHYFNKTGTGTYPLGFSTIGDPLLANVGGEDPSDYVLGSGSPAIGIGTTKPNIGADFTGAPVNTPTCSDGIQNGDETGVDCGGSCSPCNSPSTGRKSKIFGIAF